MSKKFTTKLLALITALLLLCTSFVDAAVYYLEDTDNPGQYIEFKESDLKSPKLAKAFKDLTKQWKAGWRQHVKVVMSEAEDGIDSTMTLSKRNNVVLQSIDPDLMKFIQNITQGYIQNNNPDDRPEGSAIIPFNQYNPDITPPAIQVEGDQYLGKNITNIKNHNIKVSIIDDRDSNPVVLVKVNNVEVQKQNDAYNIVLTEGNNEVTISAIDNEDNEDKKIYSVVLDTTEPVIDAIDSSNASLPDSISAINYDFSKDFEFKVKCEEPLSKLVVMFDGTKLAPDVNDNFVITGLSSLTGIKELSIEAEDLAGNISTISYIFNLGGQLSVKSIDDLVKTNISEQNFVPVVVKGTQKCIYVGENGFDLKKVLISQEELQSLVFYLGNAQLNGDSLISDKSGMIKTLIVKDSTGLLRGKVKVYMGLGVDYNGLTASEMLSIIPVNYEIRVGIIKSMTDFKATEQGNEDFVPVIIKGIREAVYIGTSGIDACKFIDGNVYAYTYEIEGENVFNKGKIEVSSGVATIKKLTIKSFDGSMEKDIDIYVGQGEDETKLTTAEQISLIPVNF